ncbi:MAG: 4-hydroxythreonine-4-phosphate dehydrogenase PdxA [Planctomycetes bacterium]|nr:4-hydroxythreonine-4-phosphate dehydrogenase PdxA [Planctomycetota bacterium]
MSKLPSIAITIGDPAGIGPEVVLKSMADPEVRKLARFVIIGHDEVLQRAEKKLKTGAKWSLTETPSPAARSGVFLYEPEPLSGKIPQPGKWTVNSGRMSLAYVETAIEMCRNGKADALVTGPICKAAWKATGAKWPGHTELLAEKTGTADFVMMLAGKGLRVALVTIHESLSSVPRLISKDRIVSTTKVVAEELERSFGITEPKIAILGLNPHAGEDGHMGLEEKTAISPAIKVLRRQKINAIGPLPADMVFHYAMKGDYDAVVAMYHDQGLGPLKTVAFDCGVNITLGLPIIRTSVDHGTAFNIAGKGVANEASCTEAIRTAAYMVGMRGRG